MKTLLTLLSFLAITSTAYSQATDSLPSVLNPEKRAEFIGGVDGWIKFLERNLNRDLMYKNNAPRGSYRVIGNFLVDTDGSVKDIRIEVDPGYGAVDEFKRVLKLSDKKWTPAIDNGKPVPFRHKQSITLMQNF